MVQALARTADQAEARQAFAVLGRERMAEFERTGQSMPWDEVRQYLLERAAGRPALRPKARKFKA